LTEGFTETPGVEQERPPISRQSLSSLAWLRKHGDKTHTYCYYKKSHEMKKGAGCSLAIVTTTTMENAPFISY
jgi:hypothetical protein